MGKSGTCAGHAATDLARGLRGPATPRGSEPEEDRRPNRNRRYGSVTRSLTEISVAVAASAIIALMVAGGGAAAERMASADAWATEPTSCQPPFTWRDSACRPPLSWYEPD